MSDNFRIFVTEKEIVIRIFTYKTPRRWAKRQRIMRHLRFKENTIKDLGSLNRGQSMFLNLHIKGYTHVTLAEYKFSVELIVYADNKDELETAEMIIRNLMGDGDSIEIEELENEDGPFVVLKWRATLIETEL